MAAAFELCAPRLVSTTLTEVKSDLASLEQLISLLLQKQTDLSARLTSLEVPRSTCPVGRDVKVNACSPRASTWSTVVRGSKRRFPPPGPARLDGAGIGLKLHNSFAPLALLPTPPGPRLNEIHKDPTIRSSIQRRGQASNPRRPRGSRKATSNSNRSPGGLVDPGHASGKRGRRPASPLQPSRKGTSKRDRSPGGAAGPELAAEKRPRVSSPSLETSTTDSSSQPPGSDLANHPAGELSSAVGTASLHVGQSSSTLSVAENASLDASPSTPPVDGSCQRSPANFDFDHLTDWPPLSANANDADLSASQSLPAGNVLPADSNSPVGASTPANANAVDMSSSKSPPTRSSVCKASLDSLSSPGLSDAGAVSPATDGNPAVGPVLQSLQLPSSTAIYGDAECDPEILIVGDSIVRHLILPRAVTYCVSGGRIIDISKLIPTLLDVHPNVNIVIAHVGTNDVMARNSLKLQRELETLCFTVESLGKRCIMSGPIPFNSTHSERFSRLLSLHNWLKNFCSDAGFDFIANFDIFWTNSHLYKPDGVHPNSRGIQQLTTNFIHFIASTL